MRNPPDGDDDPSEPGTMILARILSIMRPLKAWMLASSCITCSGGPVTSQRWRLGGTGPGQGAFFTLIKLTLLRMSYSVARPDRGSIFPDAGQCFSN